MIKKYFTGLLLVWSMSLHGQITATKKIVTLSDASSPAEAGMSAERLGRIDNALQSFVDNGKLPGAVALIARNGRIIYHKAFGYGDFPAKRPMKTDDIFRIASMSKAITSTAALILYEEGKFALDDPISLYIPEFKNPQVIKTYRMHDTTFISEPARREITVRDLFRHTSGLNYGVIANEERFSAINAKAGIVDLYTTRPVILGDNIKKLAKQPLQHHPGEKYTYGLNSDVLGYLVEIWSGMPLDQFMRQRIFEPLGMNDTYFYLPDAKAGRLVKVHKPEPNNQWSHYPATFYDPEYPVKGAKTFFSGGAGLSSTAKDYAIFLQMLLNKGIYNGKRILSRPTVELFTASNQAGDLFGGGDTYFSLGFSVVTEQGWTKGLGSVGQFSWGGYFNTNYWADPKENIVFVLMKQTQQTNENSKDLITRLVYQAIED